MGKSAIIFNKSKMKSVSGSLIKKQEGRVNKVYKSKLCH